ncbi:MAG: ATP-binding protein [Acidimicrobiales bacterium]
MIEDEIRLSLPAEPEFARLARLAVGGLASRVGFDYDEVEDLRIAVSEACSLLIGPAPSRATVTLVFRLGADGMEIDVTGGHRPTPVGTDALSGQILEAVVDRHEVRADGVRLYKRRSNGRP